MKSVRKAAVLLSGTGVYDGSEVFESTSILMNLHKHNYEFQCFSLNQNMTQVVNHLTSDEQKEERNILVESNRIARGQCIDIKKLKVDEFDCLVLPGGFGAAKNFSDFGFKGKDMKVNQDIERVLKEFKNSNKAIAGCCISPIILSKVFGNIKITLGKKGDDFPYSDSIDVAKSFGSQLVECDIDEICLDQDNKIITTPAFMKDTKNWNNVYDGIDKMISELEKIIYSKMKNYSPIQKNVLSLYRNFLRYGIKNFDKKQYQKFQDQIRQKFEENKNISRTKINYIEYRLRQGKNILSNLEKSNVSQFHFN